ncbi:hypothetical protein BAE44_0026202 [Dichanthelium oligosanthes]|uniref:Endonuclease/exonuclease/phosphatase domain-containing protein n=1 Tax=Dichanthelium oligosanthes TaxID=888268 RepID=A0A1E5UIT7_9POAL|nr:hypothetical protein BAE44_0026202 [Dichanthelium oligosanthes]
MDRFREALEHRQLHYLGFEGHIFTWRNHNHVAEEYIKERLDRVVANDQWRRRFPTFRVMNGDPRHSDHRPIIIYTDRPRDQERRTRPKKRFHFETSWLGEEKCADVVTNAWKHAMESAPCSVQEALRGVAGSLMDWSGNVLGDLEKRVKKVKMELEKCRRRGVSRDQVAMEEVLRVRSNRRGRRGNATQATPRRFPRSNGSTVCVEFPRRPRGNERSLRYRLEKLEEQVDMYRRQRAHVRWLEKGDCNTSFFHALAQREGELIGSGESKRRMGDGWRRKRRGLLFLEVY